MKRRRVIVGIGGISAGLSSVFGTSAFSNTQGNRNLSVSVVNDDDAYLRFSDTHAAGTGQMFATWRDGMVEFDFGENDGILGTGLGSESRYRFEDVFVVENQGTNPIVIYGEYSDDAVSEIKLLQTSGVNKVASGDGGRIKPLTESSPSDVLSPGDSALLGFAIDTTDTEPSSIETAITIIAESATS